MRTQRMFSQRRADGRVIRGLTTNEIGTLPKSTSLNDLENKEFAVPTLGEKYTFLGWFVQVEDDSPIPMKNEERDSVVYYYIDVDNLRDLTDVTQIKVLAKVKAVNIKYMLMYEDESYSREFYDNEKNGFITSYTIADLPNIRFGVPVFSETGKYEFLGWVLKLDANNSANLAKHTQGTDIYYYIPSNVNILASVTEITLVAKVKIAVYTITYKNLNGGTPPEVTEYVKSPNTYINFADESMKLEIVGYTFEGWYTDPTYTTLAPPITSSSYGDVVVWAKCKKISFVIKYVNANYDDESIEYGENAADHIRNKNPEREGYRFAGWFLNENYTRIVRDVYIAEGEEGKVITFYAKWEKEAGPVLYWIVGAFVVLTLIALGGWWLFFRPEQEKLE